MTREIKDTVDYAPTVTIARELVAESWRYLLYGLVHRAALAVSM